MANRAKTMSYAHRYHIATGRLNELSLSQLHDLRKILGLYGKWDGASLGARGPYATAVSHLPKGKLAACIQREARRQAHWFCMPSCKEWDQKCRGERFVDYVDAVLEPPVQPEAV